MENQDQAQPASQPSSRIRVVILSVLALMIAIAGSSLATYHLIPKPKADKEIQPTTNTSQADTSVNTNESVATPPVETSAQVPGWYYYTEESNDEDNRTHNLKFFRVSTSFEQADTLIHGFSLTGDYPGVVTASGKKNTVLIVQNVDGQGKIHEVNLAKKDEPPVVIMTIKLQKESAQVVRGARFVSGDKKLAYITADSKAESAENSVLHIFDLTSQTETERYELNKKSPLYAGFNFLATASSDNLIYLHETGGDGGGIWSQWYKVDRQKKSVQKLDGLPPSGERTSEGNPLPAVFSPDGLTIAYADYSTSIDQASLDTNSNAGNVYPCFTGLVDKYKNDGGTVMIMDLATKKSTELYRNLSYDRNICMNVARRILTVQWIDNSRLAFETIDGVYALEIGTKKVTPLHVFPRTYNPGAQTRPVLHFMTDPWLYFSDHSLINRTTGKQLTSVAPAAENAIFFVAN